MFNNYYLIYYDDLMPTLQSMGITREYYDKVKYEKPLYPTTMQLLTYCKKKQIIEIGKKMRDNSEYPDSISVIKLPRGSVCEFRKYYVPYCVIKSGLDNIKIKGE